MAKLTLSDISNIIGNETSAAATINANWALIETALENTLSRDGTSPNTMSADLDMNSNDINNVATLRANAVTINGTSITAGVTDWQGAWVTATSYAVNEGVKNDGSSYICILAHTSGASNEPGTGGSWTTYWDLLAAKGDTGAAGSASLADDEFRIQDDGDATKQLAFEVSGITTATTRTWTVPDSNVTFGAYSPTILNTANEAGFKAAVNLELGTDVQAYDAVLADLAGLTLSTGDILYYDGANLNNLGVGSDGQVLTLASGIPSWASGGSGGAWTNISDDDVTSSANWSETGISGYRTLKIIFDLLPVTDNTTIQLQVGHSATTWLTSSVYESEGGSGTQAGLRTAIGNATGEGVSGEITLTQFNQSRYTQIFVLGTYVFTSGASGQYEYGGVVQYSSNPLTAVRLFFSSGNIASGHVTLLGM